MRAAIAWGWLVMAACEPSIRPAAPPRPPRPTTPHRAPPPRLTVTPAPPTGTETPAPPVQDAAKAHELRGYASWYGKDWHGRPTATGGKFNRHALTAAHRTLPFGTIVRVTNTANHRSVVVEINDRGPYGKRRERIIDVSEAAAKVLDFIERGVCPISVEIIRMPPPRRKRGK